MPSQLRIALCQYTAAADEADTMALLSPLLEEAAASGADLIALPECANRMVAGRKQLAKNSTVEGHSPMLADLMEKARAWQKWMLIGSLLVKHETKADMFVNRCLVINPDGEVAARYDKIHMFDVEVGDGQTYNESAYFVPGQEAVVAEVAGIRVGLTICYDLRFPHLYRTLAQAGAEVIAVPAAFTRVTGVAHWHSLLRARAIENGVFIIAPAQCGEHAGKRQTYGHALAVDPWGKVLADGGEMPCVVTARLDLSLVAKARASIPSLANDSARGIKLVVAEK